MAEHFLPVRRIEVGRAAAHRRGQILLGFGQSVVIIRLGVHELSCGLVRGFEIAAALRARQVVLFDGGDLARGVVQSGREVVTSRLDAGLHGLRIPFACEAADRVDVLLLADRVIQIRRFG